MADWERENTEIVRFLPGAGGMQGSLGKSLTIMRICSHQIY